MATISLDKLTKTYDDGTKAVAELDLEIADGEFMVLVGPSGCGKTTALRMIAGLEEVTEGTIRIGNDVVNDLPPKRRDIAMVFQNYALYPHMSVYDNIAFGLRVRRAPKADIRRQVEHAAAILDLADELHKKPAALSGGQRQRVAMGRAIVRDPEVFLMDEPLSNLDAKLRVQMRAEIARIQRDLAVTTVYVTHDQSEAMTLGDRVCVMRAGVLQQVATPHEVYNRPANLFVAGFIGSPPMNIVVARVERSSGSFTVTFGDVTLGLDQAQVAQTSHLADYLGKDVALGIRPEDIEDASLVDDALPGTRFSTRVEIREDVGSDLFLHLASPAAQVQSDSLREALEITQDIKSSAFIARVDPRVDIREGQQIELAVNARRLHLFDIDSGRRI